MVRSLFSKLQFPYAQFPCASLSGEQLYDPLWEAVRRVENCGLKVCCMHVFRCIHHVIQYILTQTLTLQVLGATLDGNAVIIGVSSNFTSHPWISSTKLKIHLHKRNDFCSFSQILPTCSKPFEIAGSRSIYCRGMLPIYICNHACCSITQQNNGKSISWSHLTKLYHRDTSTGMGIQMVPKLKFEHISLTSFSKMCVDLAAQVVSTSSQAFILNLDFYVYYTLQV